MRHLIISGSYFLTIRFKVRSFIEVTLVVHIVPTLPEV